jgi:hypothetical protein
MEIIHFGLINVSYKGYKIHHGGLLFGLIQTDKRNLNEYKPVNCAG